MNSENNKEFDCIEMKRKAQLEIYEEIKGMTPDEEIAYFRKAVETGSLGEWWKQLKSYREVSTEEPQNVK